MSFIDLFLHSGGVTILHCGQMCLTAPWGLRKEASPGAGFVYVMEGNCVVQVDGEPEHRALFPDDFLFFTRFVSHNLCDSVNRVSVLFDDPSVPHIDRHGTVASYGGGGRQTTLYLARLAFRKNNKSLLDLLPPIIQSSNRSRQNSSWLRGSIEWIMSRASVERQGGQTLLNSLATQLFVQAVRSASDISQQDHLLFSRTGADEPEIAQLVEKLHRAPERGWSVALMAEEAGMSRAAFAERFRATVGSTPYDYLARLRIKHAQELLTTGMSVKEVAQAVGYRSSTAFARSFKRITSLAPSSYDDSV